jgi:hypothetical protein
LGQFELVFLPGGVKVGLADRNTLPSSKTQMGDGFLPADENLIALPGNVGIASAPRHGAAVFQLT